MSFHENDCYICDCDTSYGFEIFVKLGITPILQLHFLQSSTNGQNLKFDTVNDVSKMSMTKMCVYVDFLI